MVKLPPAVELAKKFAESKGEYVGSAGRMVCAEKKVFSYSVEIGRWLGESEGRTLAWMSDQHWSKTTSRHQSALRRALQEAGCLLTTRRDCPGESEAREMLLRLKDWADR